MENFKRMNKNSKLKIMNCTEYTSEDVNQGLDICENESNILLQLSYVGGVMIAEYIERTEESLTTPMGKSEADIDFENYLDTIINKDPFGGRYSGKPIKEVFLNGDNAWLDYAIKNLKNEFLRERLQYILDRGGYGKIICK